MASFDYELQCVFLDLTSFGLTQRNKIGEYHLPGPHSLCSSSAFITNKITLIYLDIGCYY